MDDHVRAKCIDPECCGDCHVCNLFICEVCGGGEGSLTVGGCCGYPLTADAQDAIYEGRIGLDELCDRAQYERNRTDEVSP